MKTNPTYRPQAIPLLDKDFDLFDHGQGPYVVYTTNGQAVTNQANI